MGRGVGGLDEQFVLHFFFVISPPCLFIILNFSPIQQSGFLL